MGINQELMNVILCFFLFLFFVLAIISFFVQLKRRRELKEYLESLQKEIKKISETLNSPKSDKLNQKE